MDFILKLEHSVQLARICVAFGNGLKVDAIAQ